MLQSVPRYLKKNIMKPFILGRQSTPEEDEAFVKCEEILGALKNPLEIIGTRPKDR